jgi:hypothetical protein
MATRGEGIDTELSVWRVLSSRDARFAFAERYATCDVVDVLSIKDERPSCGLTRPNRFFARSTAIPAKTTAAHATPTRVRVAYGRERSEQAADASRAEASATRHR